MKIAFFELEEWERKYFEKQLGADHALSFFAEPLKIDTASYAKDAEALVIFVHSEITKELLDALPAVRFIATMSTGIDHIDLAACKSKRIVVSNVPVYGEHAVAEHAFALLLAIAKRIIESNARVKSGKFSPEGLTGFTLQGKTLGVIGVGNIGSNAIKIGKGFGMNVLGYKRTPDPKLEHALGFRIVDLDTLLATSDIITLHVPYTKETHHMINEAAFSKMKQGVIIINTARGAVIDTRALLMALESGQVASAGLDVLEEEPLLDEEKDLLVHEFDKEKLLQTIENHMLLANPKVLITPHNAFNSREALEKILATTEENIHSYFAGYPQNTV